MRAQMSGFRSRMIGLQSAVVAMALATPVSAQELRQASQDEYTLYELLAPDTASFKIDYQVTATFEADGEPLVWR